MVSIFSKNSARKGISVFSKMSKHSFKAIIYSVTSCTQVAIPVRFRVLPVRLDGLYVLGQSSAKCPPPPPNPTHLPRFCAPLVHVRFLLQQFCFYTGSSQGHKESNTRRMSICVFRHRCTQVSQWKNITYYYPSNEKQDTSTYLLKLSTLRT